MEDASIDFDLEARDVQRFGATSISSNEAFEATKSDLPPSVANFREIQRCSRGAFVPSDESLQATKPSVARSRRVVLQRCGDVNANDASFNNVMATRPMATRPVQSHLGAQNTTVMEREVCDEPAKYGSNVSGRELSNSCSMTSAAVVLSSSQDKGRIVIAEAYLSKVTSVFSILKSPSSRAPVQHGKIKEFMDRFQSAAKSEKRLQSIAGCQNSPVSSAAPIFGGNIGNDVIRRNVNVCDGRQGGTGVGVVSNVGCQRSDEVHTVDMNRTASSRIQVARFWTPSSTDNRRSVAESNGQSILGCAVQNRPCSWQPHNQGQGQSAVPVQGHRVVASQNSSPIGQRQPQYSMETACHSSSSKPDQAQSGSRSVVKPIAFRQPSNSFDQLLRVDANDDRLNPAERRRCYGNSTPTRVGVPSLDISFLSCIDDALSDRESVSSLNNIENAVVVGRSSTDDTRSRTAADCKETAVNVDRNAFMQSDHTIVEQQAVVSEPAVCVLGTTFVVNGSVAAYTPPSKAVEMLALNSGSRTKTRIRRNLTAAVSNQSSSPRCQLYSEPRQHSSPKRRWHDLSSASEHDSSLDRSLSEECRAVQKKVRTKSGQQVSVDCSGPGVCAKSFCFTCAAAR